MLLSDEEIRTSLMSRPKIKTMDDLVENFNLVAKAQLKKVVEELKKHGEITDMIGTYILDKEIFLCRIPSEDWQALMRETE